MPVTAAPDVPRYVVPPVTSCDCTYSRNYTADEQLINYFTFSVDWADLAFIDLSQAKTPEGLIALSKQVRDAMTTTGFFYAINHGYTPEQVRSGTFRWILPS